MNIEKIIQILQVAMDDARGQESHFESWLIQNEAICDAIDALKEKEWVGLTKEEVEEWELPVSPTVYEFAQFIEAKLKEKNNG